MSEQERKFITDYRKATNEERDQVKAFLIRMLEEEKTQTPG